MPNIKVIVKNLPYYLAYVRKAIIQVTGLVAALLALGLLPEKYATLGATVVAVLTTVLHYITPNADAPGTVPARPLPNSDGSPNLESQPEYVGEHAASPTE